MSTVWLALTTDMAGTPARIDELPLSIVNPDSVPGMTHGLWWYWIARFEGRKSISLAVAANDHRLKASFSSQSREETGVAFADGEACGKRGGGSRGLDRAIEEVVDIIIDVMVEPGEHCTSFVRE